MVTIGETAGGLAKLDVNPAGLEVQFTVVVLAEVPVTETLSIAQYKSFVASYLNLIYNVGLLIYLLQLI